MDVGSLHHRQGGLLRPAPRLRARPWPHSRNREVDRPEAGVPRALAAAAPVARAVLGVSSWHSAPLEPSPQRPSRPGPALDALPQHIGVLLLARPVFCMAIVVSVRVVSSCRDTDGTMRDGRCPWPAQRRTEFRPRPGTLAGEIRVRDPRAGSGPPRQAVSQPTRDARVKCPVNLHMLHVEPQGLPSGRCFP